MISRFRVIRLNQGFSLVDVMIGMAILMIAIASAYQASIQSSLITASNRSLSAAVALSEAKLEELRNAPFSEVIDGADASPIDALGAAGGNYSRSWSVADNTPETGMKTVTVTVSWNQWGEPQPRDYILTAVIAP